MVTSFLSVEVVFLYLIKFPFHEFNLQAPLLSGQSEVTVGVGPLAPLVSGILVQFEFGLSCDGGLSRRRAAGPSAGTSV